MTRVLMLGMDAGRVQRLLAQLAEAGLAVESLQLNDDDAQQVAATVDSYHADVVLAEPRPSTHPRLDSLHVVRARAPTLPFIYCGASGDDAFTARALRAGATDCVSASEPLRLIAVIERALRRATEGAFHARMEQELIQAQRYQRLPLLLSALAHDLRNVLQPLMFAGVVLRNSPEPTLQRLRETLENTTQKGMDIVLSMTAFAKSREAGEEDLDVPAMMRTLKLLLPKKNTRRIEVSFDSTLAVVPCRLHQTDVEQCLLELAQTAMRAMPDGGYVCFRAREVQLEGAFFAEHENPAAGAYVCLSVESGVAPPVARAASSSAAPGHEVPVNLGLAICRTVAVQHRGLLRQRSLGEAGTVVELYLPLRDSRAENAALVTRQAVLFVTSDDRAAQHLAVSGAPAGFDVVRVTDSQTAARHIDQHALPDLAIIDTELPRLEDARVFALLRERRFAGQVILLAAPGADMDFGAASATVKLMTKPVATSQLLAALHEGALQPNTAPH